MSEEFITGQSAGLGICKAFGLDPRQVAQVRIVCLPGDIAKIVITKHITRDDLDSLTATLEEFRIVPKDG